MVPEGRPLFKWADCSMEDRCQDAYQMLQRQIVRFAKSVCVREVTAYSGIYGLHPRLFNVDREGRTVRSSKFSLTLMRCR